MMVEMDLIYLHMEFPSLLQFSRFHLIFVALLIYLTFDGNICI